MIKRILKSALGLFLVLGFVGATWAQAPDRTIEEVFKGLSDKYKAAPAQVRLITDNTDAWYARWHMIENAKVSIDTTYFILEDDIFGRSFLGLLFKKAKEGVKIRIMLDARGTKTFVRTFLGRDVLQELAALPNVQIRVFNPIFKAIWGVLQDVRSVVASNHDKLVIADGEWLITGGRNISASYFGDPRDVASVYRDTDILVRGGSSPEQGRLAFEEEFARSGNCSISKDLLGNWRSRSVELELARRLMQSHLLGGGVLDLSKTAVADEGADIQAQLAKYPHLVGYAAFRPFQGERSYPTVLLDKHSVLDKEKNEITPALRDLCDAAKSEILIQNPYVILTKGGREALIRAGSRGVKIVICTNSPESSDSLLTQAMFLREWKTHLKDIPNLRIHAIRGERKLHAKVFVVDRKLAAISTYNMDPLSETVNSEDLMLVHSPAFATQNALRIEEDMAKSSSEYKIEVRPDGTIREVFGPSSHVSQALLGKLETLGAIAFLRPLI